MTGPLRVLAPNPGPMTLDGTNTWVLEGGVVIDPGPLDEGHLQAVLDAADQQVRIVLLTHGHADHSAGVARFVELAGGPPVRAYDPDFGEPMRDGETIAGLHVLHVPGHTADSVAFWSPEEGLVFTGDTVLGRGTSVVAHPDGALGPYLASLRRLRDLATTEHVERLLPGHGPIIGHPQGVLEHYLAHRAERLEQVRDALAAGATSAQEVVRLVYADVDPALWPAAEQSVRAQLDYLTDED